MLYTVSYTTYKPVERPAPRDDVGPHLSLPDTEALRNITTHSSLYVRGGLAIAIGHVALRGAINNYILLTLPVTIEAHVCAIVS
jgi:hypothetical protein